jgi:trehalose synthase
MAFEVDISPIGTERFRSVLTADRYEEFLRATREAHELLAGRVVWNVNSTAKGGGVVELLRPLVGYARGAGVDARWAVIEGTPEFFTVTKRIHNRLHGAEGDGGSLDDTARGVYEQVLEDNAAELAESVRDGDVVILHDPQTAGLVDAMRARGAAVIWRCHVGIDHPDELAREAWRFLLPYLQEADAYVFSRESFAWEGLARSRIAVIPPSIDPFAPKNMHLAPDTVAAILSSIGVFDGPETGPVTFRRPDGTPGRIERRARLVEDDRLGPATPVVLQVSRWDALKDPVGVIRGFAEHVPEQSGAHLVYAAPAVEAVADDPEGAQVMRRSIAARDELDERARARIHLVTLPMDDHEENAVMINALQRHARVIVQKSLAEGFGLTVSEAMWKARPVVASRVGGIEEQIVHGDSGLLLDDPRDLAAFGAAVTELLADRSRAEQMGQRGRERVRDRFTSVRSLLDYLALVRRVKSGSVAA